MNKKWLEWAQRLQFLAQAGLEYSKDDFDLERFKMIRAISVEIMSEYADMDFEQVHALFANEKGYQTPKVDIRAAVFKDGKLLFVEEKAEGKWSLPGGWADIGYSILENMKKECLEEAGVIAKPVKLIAVLDRSRHHDDVFPYWVYKFFIECDYIEGSYIDNLETGEARFFAENELPELSVGRNTHKQIEMCFNARKNPDFKTVLD